VNDSVRTWPALDIHPVSELLQAAPRHAERAGAQVRDDAVRALDLPRGWRLGLVHPVTGEPLRVEEPLPADLAEALARARDDLRP